MTGGRTAGQFHRAPVLSLSGRLSDASWGTLRSATCYLDHWVPRKIPLPSTVQIRFKTAGFRAKEVVVGQLGFFDLSRRYEGLTE